jgi:hypothetical protein
MKRSIWCAPQLLNMCQRSFSDQEFDVNAHEYDFLNAKEYDPANRASLPKNTTSGRFTTQDSPQPIPAGFL